MRKLMVNIDHVATLREARGVYYPDPVYAAGIAEMAGASGIIVHLREDRRHIKDRDVRLLREVVRTKLNLEMAATEEMVGIAREILPDMVTLVPEKRQELTTEGGLDVAGNRDRIGHGRGRAQGKGHRREPLRGPGRSPGERGTGRGGRYDRDPHGPLQRRAGRGAPCGRSWQRIIAAAQAGKAAGMGVNAGHGLHYDNVRHRRRSPRSTS